MSTFQPYRGSLTWLSPEDEEDLARAIANETKQGIQVKAKAIRQRATEILKQRPLRHSRAANVVLLGNDWLHAFRRRWKHILPPPQSQRRRTTFTRYVQLNPFAMFVQQSNNFGTECKCPDCAPVLNDVVSSNNYYSSLIQPKPLNDNDDREREIMEQMEQRRRSSNAKRTIDELLSLSVDEQQMYRKQQRID